ncbi:MAG TPA: cell wall-binding repeat-containing protein [Euzebya sp.]|nr:cell wall-binding repeat-containing protein [Euzebya sp.]
MIRHTVARAPVALLAAVVTLLALAGPAFAQAPVTRLGPSGTAVAQAIAWSQASFADGSSPSVIIARDDDFADALGSGALQGALQAPLLLTNSDALSPEVAAEVDRLGATEAIVLGGDAAVGPGVVAALEALGLTAERVAGATRLETAIAIIHRFFPNATTVVVARAFGTQSDPTQAFADALTVAPYAAASNIPVLLTSSDRLDAPTDEALRALPVQDVVVVGGTSAVAEEVIASIETAIDDGDAATQESVRRIAGATRFATAALLNAELGYTTAADAPRVILSEGQDTEAWASGFPAGAQAGNGAATVLANGPDLPAETVDFLQGSGVPLICGPGVFEAACDAAVEAINS